ncbi:MAG: TetR/AcrR family transcriptional regulator [Ruminococcus sp.]|nr:TetR/AcrR family transcriptional regulator [Ruminococcus sp.]
MNKSESKYFNTARRMDEALLSLLYEKDFEYVTIKEICSRANVNRSTFYLHYENIGDLLFETIQLVNEKFSSSYFVKDFSIKGKDCDELYFMTDEWIIPYLNFVRKNKHIYKAIHENSTAFGVEKAFGNFFQKVFSPILSMYGVPKEKHEYVMTFYRHGLVSIIMKWVDNDCIECPEFIMDIINILFRGQQSSKSKNLLKKINRQNNQK